VATTAHHRKALRASPRRPASLSLAEGRKSAPRGEIGDNSVSYARGTGKARRLLDTEYLWELRGQSAYTTYDKMRFSDPKIAGLRFAQNLPLLRAGASIEPSDAEDKDAVEKAELVQRLLIDDFPWRAFVADTTLCMDYGFSCFEIVWRIEEGEARFRLALRPSSSIYAEDIYITDGAIDRVVQRPKAGGSLEIPGDRLLWFCHSKEGDDFRGRSILRPMYKPWKLKQEVEVQLAVLIGKMGGVPVFTEHGTLDEDTQAMLDEAGESFGIAAGAFVRKPEDVDLELLASNAKVGEVLEAIKYWDTQLSGVAQAQVLDLGIGQMGSRALGTTLSDMFAASIQAQASYREDVLNARGGLIEQIVAYNFPNIDNLPALRFGNVQASDMKSMAQAFLWLSQAGMNLGEETWDWVRAEMNLPESDDLQVEVPDEVPVPPTVPAAPEPPATPPAPPSDDALPEGGAQASEAHTHPADGLRLAERRPPRGVEVYIDMAEITATFDTAKTAVKDATAVTREALSAELVRRALAAADKGDLTKFTAGAPPMVDKLSAEIAAVLSRFYDAGRQQVTDELQRQRQGRPWSAWSVRMAEPESPSSLPLGGLDALKQQALAMARAIATAMMNLAGMQAARRIANTPVDEAVMVAMVKREADAAALRYTGAASDFMSMGRSAEAHAREVDIEDAVYSALLDNVVCSACEPRDGETTTNLDEAATWCPNPDCEGGDRCRCLVVYEIRQAPRGPSMAESVVALAEAVKQQNERPIEVNLATAAPTLHMPPAEITINVPEPKPEPPKPVKKPRRVKRTAEFVKDERGQIVGKTETETDGEGRVVKRESTFELDESGRIVGKTETESEE